MSIPVIELVNEAAREIGDVPKNRVTEDDWLQFYNDTTEQISLRWQVLEEDATFDLVVDEDRYIYPEAMVQMKRLRYSQTPSDPLTYLPVDELFEDEIRSREVFTKQVGDTLDGYWARAGFFQIRPRPTLTVSDGGLISYWKRADKATVLQDATLALPSTLRLITRERMVIRAKERLARYDEATRDLARWENEMSRVAVPIEDRSDDRRPRVRAGTSRTSDGLL